MSDTDEKRPDQTLADYVGIVISPVLIMSMVGSLVFFLARVAYSGRFDPLLYWYLSWFVFGIVLVGRISMLPGIANRSSLYGSILAGIMWLAMIRFVHYPEAVRRLLPPALEFLSTPLINLGWIVIAWWSSYRLVWDCTNVDEDADMSGEGLLQASGFESRGQPADRLSAAREKTSATPFVAWWERWQRFRELKEKKRILGVWVIYFSLAALPLFGLGQALVPPDDLDRRRNCFWLLAVYVASGFGLLLTTCFLGLRRYLRQRRLKMPRAMTATWLAFGGSLLVAFLVVAAVIPRPHAEYTFVDLQRLTSGEQSASSHAVKGDSPGKGAGRPGSAPEKSDPNAKATGNQGEKATAQGEEKGDRSANENPDGRKGSASDQNRDDENKQDQRAAARREKDTTSSQVSAGEGQRKDEASETQRDRTSSAGSMTGKVPAFLKWVIFAVVALAAAGYAAYGVVRHLANFTDWAARFLKRWAKFWAWLFGRRPGRRRAGEASAALASHVRGPRSFRSFQNPFDPAQPWTPYELACYTFAAFEALARERGVSRKEGETPLEHAERVAAEVPGLEREGRRLALIYARGLYASGELPVEVNEVLREVWRRMETGAEQPLAV
jgi:hypothetical protein